MKKLLAIALSLSLSLSLAACGKKGPGPGSGSGSGQQQTTESDWPTGTVQFLLPAKAGGATDLSGRAFAAVLQQKFGKDFVIVNQTDGSGVVAFENARTAKADGSTLLYYHSGMYVSLATGLYDKDPVEEFSMIANLIAGGSYSVVVAAKIGRASCRERV